MTEVATETGRREGTARSRWQLRGLVLALAATMFLTLGCIRYELAFSVNDDGSGAIGVLFAMSDQFTAMTGTNVQQALGVDPANLPGTSVEPYSADGFSGILMQVPFANLQQLGVFFSSPQSQELARDLALAPNESGGWSFATVMAPAMETAGDQAAAATALPPELLQGGWARVRVELPGEIADHNADRVENGAFIWDIDFTSPEPRQLMASTVAATAAGPAAPDTGHGPLAGTNGQPDAGTLGAIALGLGAVLVAGAAVATRRRASRA